MPIEFACQCGKSFRAADEHAGRRAKCSQCGEVLTIPAASARTAAMSTAPSDRRCPSCQNPLSADAILCINCGFNLATGKKMNTFAYAPSADDAISEKPRRRSRVGKVLTDRLTSWKLWSGLGTMILSGVLMAAVFMSDHLHFRARVFGVLGLLFFAGGFTFINGLCDGDNA
jgi:hypothetical protein